MCQPGNVELGELELRHELEPSSLDGKSAFDTADMQKFLAQPRIAVLSYIRADGRPNQAPIWYDYSDDTVRMTIATGSAKHRPLLKDDRVCVMVQDERPPYRAVIIDGTLDMTDLPEGDTLGFDMAVRYLGKYAAGEYWKMTEEEREKSGTSVLTLVPTEVKGFDNTRTINRALLTGVRVRNTLPIPRHWL
jgi:PPOX class probable F420-dependent enzyme